MKKVLVADSHYLTRKGMTTLVEGMQGYTTLPTATSVKDVTYSLQNHKPDLLIASNLNDCLDSFDQVMQQWLQYLKGYILFLFKDQTEKELKHLLRMGVKAIIDEKSSKEDITNAIAAAAGGNSFFSQQIYELAFRPDPPIDESGKNLSDRELEVLLLIAKGQPTSAIADRLNVSIHTINTHRKNILRKLDLVSPAQLIAYAYENKLVQY